VVNRCKVKLGRRQVDLVAVETNRPSREIDVEAVGRDHRRLRLVTYAPQVGVQPRHELARAERLGDVVVGASGQGSDLRVLVADRREHDQRDFGPLPKPPAHLYAVAVGQHEIDDPRVRSGDRGDVECLLGGRCRQRLKPGVAQDHSQRPQDLNLVVADQHLGPACGIHTVAPTGAESRTGSDTTKLVP
jgi:hypothetical protein